MKTQDDNSDFWGEPIHVYTRAQAIADGILVDLTTATDDQGQRLCLQAGFKIPVAITRTAWGATVEASGTWKPTDDGETLELKGGQSLTGRLWDVLWMLNWLRVGRATPTGCIFKSWWTYRAMSVCKDSRRLSPISPDTAAVD